MSPAARAVTVAGSPKLGIYAADMDAQWGRPRKVGIVSVEQTAEEAWRLGWRCRPWEIEAFRAFFSDLVAGL